MLEHLTKVGTGEGERWSSPADTNCRKKKHVKKYFSIRFPLVVNWSYQRASFTLLGVWSPNRAGVREQSTDLGPFYWVLGAWYALETRWQGQQQSKCTVQGHLTLGKNRWISTLFNAWSAWWPPKSRWSCHWAMINVLGGLIAVSGTNILHTWPWVT